MKQKILLGSALALAVSSSLSAEKLAETTLDALSAEAGETIMQEVTPAKALEAEPAVVPSAGDDVDSLSKSVADQLTGILGEVDTVSEEETETKLEEVVSSALIGGASMNDLRSAVSDAMDEISASEKLETTEDKIKQASESLKKLVSEQKAEDAGTSDAYLRSLQNEASEFAESEKQEQVPEKTVANAAEPKPAVKPERVATDQNQLETITVAAGESLFKIALRVYGSGDSYLKLYEANKDVIADPNIINVGQVLKIPK